jgi:ribosomal protein L24E
MLMLDVIAKTRRTCDYCHELIESGELYVESGPYLTRYCHKRCYHVLSDR